MNSKTKITDPYFERETAKYDNPIPSREYIMDYLRERGKPATRVNLVRALAIETDEQKEALRRRLRAMERDGQLVFTRKGGYGLADKMGLISGRVIGHREGYGFLARDDGEKDVFLNAKQMRALFDGDRALVRVFHTDHKGRAEGELVEVLERAHQQLVGRYILENGVGFVIPENKRISQDIIIPESCSMGAKENQIVVAEILAPPTFRSQPVARVVEILGEQMAPGMEVDVAIRAYGLPYDWSQACIDEAESFGAKVADDNYQNRKDLRKKPFVTIDGEDAKDFDDAVYCEAKAKDGWLLYVAIADVSFYVKPNSALDKEAFLRGNSVYFPGQVIPMLPVQLSNELCSLKPNQDRLTLVCEMAITATGKISRYRFYEAVIHSKARMTYTNVHKILVQKDKKLQKQYRDLLPHLQNLYQVYQILLQQRQLRGALDFDTQETRIIYSNDQKIEKIIPYERNDAHKLIEECMLVANVCASKFIAKHNIPCLYRVHEGPTREKLADVRSFLAELGLTLKGGEKPQPKDYAQLLDIVATRTDAQLLQLVLLRSLTQAIYTPENKGHFGLAFDCYTHFTSPIRRYPDLLVHRAIRQILSTKKNKDSLSVSLNEMIKYGEHCSMTERRADDASRNVIDCLKCEFMQEHVGEIYEGIITGVTHFGLFVQLKEVFVEGLVHISELASDYYEFDAKKHRLLGQRTRKIYRLTDSICIKVARVDLEQKQIDFVLAEDKKPPVLTKKKGKK